MQWLTLNELTTRFEFVINRMDDLIKSMVENRSAKRWERRQFKKNKRNTKYEIFLLRTSPQPDVDQINKLKRLLILLEEENRESFSKYSNLYVMYIRNRDICAAERLDLATYINKKRNRA